MHNVETYRSVMAHFVNDEIQQRSSIPHPFYHQLEAKRGPSHFVRALSYVVCEMLGFLQRRYFSRAKQISCMVNAKISLSNLHLCFKILPFVHQTCLVANKKIFSFASNQSHRLFPFP